MKRIGTIAGLAALGLATAGGAAALATGQEPSPAREAGAPKPATKAEAAPPGPSLAEKLERLLDEYEAARRTFYSFYRGSTIPEADMAKAREAQPDYPAVVRRILDLAATAPKDPAVRDAMLWMIANGLGGADSGPEAGEFALAAHWLPLHFGDDPDAVRVGLDLDRAPNAYRDHLLLTFYASAKGRESKGLARLALGQYLHHKALSAEAARKIEGRPTYVHDDLVRADGTLYTEEQLQPDERYAYLLHLKQCDAAYLREEAERLCEEVIAEYADVPYVTANSRRLEALLKRPDAKLNGKPITDESRRKIEERLARRSTLGEVAEARLDDWRNLAVGKPAPEILGVDAQGSPLRLSDHRGKVVVLAFWGSWCGPCVAEIPREKALVERMRGRPFAMLGINTDETPEAARKAMEAHGVSWPNWLDGSPGVGPIAKLYHVRGYPTVFVLDAEGKIRSKNAHGQAMEKLVDDLTAGREAAGR